MLDTNICIYAIRNRLGTFWHALRTICITDFVFPPSLCTMDMLIATHARSEGLVLVTNNVREFERVQDLVIENWVSMDHLSGWHIA